MPNGFLRQNQHFLAVQKPATAVKEGSLLFHAFFILFLPEFLMTHLVGPESPLPEPPSSDRKFRALLADLWFWIKDNRKKGMGIFLKSNAVAVVTACFMLLFDALGKTKFNTGPALHDFQSFWSAALAVKAGLAGKVYDVHWFVDHIKQTMGAEAQQYAWHYPPQFFLPLMGLAYLPLPLAFITALRIGFALLPFVEQKRPSGLMTSLVAFKPHLGLAFPAAYLGGGFWTSIALTAFWLLVQVGVTALVLGPQIWVDFLQSLARTRDILFTEIGAGAHHYVSVYGAVRLLHGGATLAYVMQGVVIVITLGLLWRVWRCDIDRNIKAALLVATIPLTAPYLMHYDMCMGIVACILIMRFQPFDLWPVRDQGLLIAVWVLSWANLLIQEHTFIPTGLICNLVVYALALKQALALKPDLLWGLGLNRSAASDQGSGH
jgi:hypothetical protein